SPGFFIGRDLGPERIQAVIDRRYGRSGSKYFPIQLDPEIVLLPGYAYERQVLQVGGIHAVKIGPVIPEVEFIFPECNGFLSVRNRNKGTTDKGIKESGGIDLCKETDAA